MTAETRLVDYSDARPAPELLKAHHYAGAMRYIALGTSDKHLTAAEAHALHASGLAVGLVAESTANRATAGYQAGVDDAHATETAAHALGVPASVPLFAAVDFDATWSQVADYLRGWGNVLTDRAGEYGPWDVIDGSHLPYHWQAGGSTAWSAGRNARLHPHAHLYQRGPGACSVPGCDENVVCRPIRLWGNTGAQLLMPPGFAVTGRAPHPAHQPAPVPAPAPKPTPAPTGAPHGPLGRPQGYHKGQAIHEARDVARNAAKHGNTARARVWRRLVNRMRSS